MHCGAFEDELLQGIDRIAISPGVPLAEPFVQRAMVRGIPVEGDIELLAQQLATNDYRRTTKVIAITGANGKTTVTSMVGAMCCGSRAGYASGGQHLACGTGCIARTRYTTASVGAGTVQLPA